LVTEAHPLLATAATGVAVVEPVVPPVLEVVVGPEVVVDDVLDPPQAVATTATATMTTPHHLRPRLTSPGLTL
jgi:hypothetical protein